MSETSVNRVLRLEQEVETVRAEAIKELLGRLSEVQEQLKLPGV